MTTLYMMTLMITTCSVKEVRRRTRTESSFCTKEALREE